MTPIADAVPHTAQALVRFFAFFFVLNANLVVVIAMSIWLVSPPFDKAWSVVAALALTALVLLVFTVIATIVYGLAQRRHPMTTIRAAEEAAPAQGQ